ncbi:hypothetical protein MPK66_gp095 [Erwinia phage pEa_SNUABM_2]|uniref:Uncharacterized protein n=1 Tax=Erwinia phage pEa_SNUABM_2 TaxID=2869547 RepID=A0AAE7XMT3_9CAUD|nr:hypothetical protein MPK66_gp095 [Erwinia phage pEa_SNUABM_2]QZE59339.1 hypothetical protein pEaSNUABM2_00095 [Erwinia phage pEa_SNUABM_2]QZE59675.1 hypothetical protein pEaSNUABM39_00095 [Erwinia phage pEa_SNUABM_39]
MLFAQNFRSVKKHMIERSLFLFDASTPKPDLSILTWTDFVKLCAEKSVTSAKDFAADGTIPLNPAAGISADGTRQWLHTRFIFHTWTSNKGIVTGSLAPVNAPTVPSYRYMERQFALDMSDDMGMMTKGNDSSGPVALATHGINKTLPIMSDSLLNGWVGNTMYGVSMTLYTYPATLDANLVVAGNGFAWNSNSYQVVTGNAISAAAMSYSAVARVVNYNNSGGTYYTLYWGVPNLYHAVSGKTPGVSVPTWGMAAIVDEKKTLHIAMLAESELAQVAPVMNGNGTARLNVPEPQYTYEL